MNDIMNLVVMNLEKVGIGVVIFALAYVSNIFLGIWRNVRIDGMQFDWKLLAESALKFVVLGLGIAILSVTVSILPQYAIFVGLEIASETMEIIDSVVIVGAFLYATIRYVIDAIGKLKQILGVE